MKTHHTAHVRSSARQIEHAEAAEAKANRCHPTAIDFLLRRYLS